MTFLQPMLLVGLPLVTLPIIIHLINLRRHRTVQWGAMMFLLAATRQKRGRTRLRHFLIMLARMLAIAGLIIAISRPMAGGWFGLFGGKPDTVIIVLDRSASMSQQDVQSGQSKRSLAVTQIAVALERAGAPPNLVLIESGTNKPQLISTPEALLEMPETGATDGAANIPTMLTNALDYLVANKAGRTDIWICSDLQGSDWSADSGQWEAIASGFGELPQTVRFHLLTYSQPASENFSVRVTKIRRERFDAGHHLIMDVSIRRFGSSPGSSIPEGNKSRVPLEIVVDGARSVVDVEMVGDAFLLTDHTVPIDGDRESGAGKVELPNDANPRDNVFFFSYGDDTMRRTVVVSNQPGSAWPLTLAAAPPSQTANAAAEIVRPDDISSVQWDDVALVLWQAQLPKGTVKAELERFVADGGNVIFFPSADDDDEMIFDTSWGAWEKLQIAEESDIENWRDDSGLLAQSDAGSPLPVNRLSISEYRQIQGDGQVLASLRGGSPLLSRVPTDAGGVYFSATLPQQPFSNLAREGIVFFVMVQRALEDGAARLLQTQLGIIGDRIFGLGEQAWQRVEGWPESNLSTQQKHVAGVYRVGDRLIARNRPKSEDVTAPLNSKEIDRLFTGLDYRVVQETVADPSSLVSEIWRAFVVLLILALIAEAALCLPDVRPKKLVL